MRQVRDQASEEAVQESFADFFRSTEPRISQALIALFGPDIGRDASADALAYGWEHWHRICGMNNPAGYLYVVGRNKGRQTFRRRPPIFPAVDQARLPWVEPGLPRALAALPDRQRVVVMLLNCFGWTMAEVADLLGVSRSTVQNHAERAMSRLRKDMGVTE